MKKKKDPLITALEITFEAQLNTGKPWSTFQRCFITQLGQHTSTLQYFFLKVVQYLTWYRTDNVKSCIFKATNHLSYS